MAGAADGGHLGQAEHGVLDDEARGVLRADVQQVARGVAGVDDADGLHPHAVALGFLETHFGQPAASGRI